MVSDTKLTPDGRMTDNMGFVAKSEADKTKREGQRASRFEDKGYKFGS